jgi:rRNA maturation protein Nop10
MSREQRTFYRHMGNKTYIQFTCQICGERIEISQPRSYGMLPSSSICGECGERTAVPTPCLYLNSLFPHSKVEK